MASFLLVLRLIGSCGTLCSDEALQQYAILLVRGGFSVKTEIAAFLVRSDDGRLRLVVWKNRYQSAATYKGRIPRGTIAVVHTHPMCYIEPSRLDRAEAARTGLPIIVLTPSAVTVAWSDGRVSYVAHDGGWRQRATPKRNT